MFIYVVWEQFGNRDYYFKTKQNAMSYINKQHKLHAKFGKYKYDPKQVKRYMRECCVYIRKASVN